MNPDEDSYRLNLAVLYMNTGDFAAALPLWEELARRGDRWIYRVYRAKTLMEMARYEEAIGTVEQPALERESAGAPAPAPGDPGLDDAFDVLAMSYRGKGDLEKALRYIEKSVELRPGNIVHLINYGVLLAESGMVEQGKAQWRKVLELDPENEVAKGNLAAFGE